MGVGNSRELNQTNGMDQDSESSQPHMSPHSADHGSDDEEGVNIPSIMGYLIRSRQIHPISKDIGESESNTSDEELMAHPTKTPMTHSVPDVKELQNNDIYSMVMKSSGRWSDTRWHKHWNHTLPNIMAKRELGVSKPQQFTHGDMCYINSRGHCILNTLIRCKFSPEASTGQGYVYTGCATGSVVVYDILTGKVERKLEGHSSCVRDVSWHPYKNIIISTSWDGKLLQWTYTDGCPESVDSRKKEVAKSKRLKKFRRHVM